MIQRASLREDMSVHPSVGPFVVRFPLVDPLVCPFPVPYYLSRFSSWGSVFGTTMYTLGASISLFDPMNQSKSRDRAKVYGYSKK